MSFLNENTIFLKTFIVNELCLRISDDDLKNVINSVIVKYHTKDHNLNLCVLIKTNTVIESDVLDSIGLTLVRMGWPRSDSSIDVKKLFNLELNKHIHTQKNLD